MKVIVGLCATMTSNTGKKSLSTHLVAGGCAGLVEAMVCHPLDTIKVRMQLRTNRAALNAATVNAWDE